MSKKSVFRISLFVLGLGCLAVGVAQEQHLLVMRKAIYICLECIGIG
ncbi:MAG: CD1871A family CXXC motif-containing protein [Eubacteriales bacterium]